MCQQQLGVRMKWLLPTNLEWYEYYTKDLSKWNTLCLFCPICIICVSWSYAFWVQKRIKWHKQVTPKKETGSKYTKMRERFCYTIHGRIAMMYNISYYWFTGFKIVITYPVYIFAFGHLASRTISTNTFAKMEGTWGYTKWV